MRKYRILTNGERFKAQIRDTWLWIPYWATLQKNTTEHSIPLIFIDILYNTYDEAKKDVIRYNNKKEKDEKWWPVK